MPSLDTLDDIAEAGDAMKAEHSRAQGRLQGAQAHSVTESSALVGGVPVSTTLYDPHRKTGRARKRAAARKLMASIQQRATLNAHTVNRVARTQGLHGLRKLNQTLGGASQRVAADARVGLQSLRSGDAAWLVPGSSMAQAGPRSHVTLAAPSDDELAHARAPWSPEAGVAPASQAVRSGMAPGKGAQRAALAFPPLLESAARAGQMEELRQAFGSQAQAQLERELRAVVKKKLAEARTRSAQLGNAADDEDACMAAVYAAVLKRGDAAHVKLAATYQVMAQEVLGAAGLHLPADLTSEEALQAEGDAIVAAARLAAQQAVLARLPPAPPAAQQRVAACEAQLRAAAQPESGALGATTWRSVTAGIGADVPAGVTRALAAAPDANPVPTGAAPRHSLKRTIARTVRQQQRLDQTMQATAARRDAASMAQATREVDKRQKAWMETLHDIPAQASRPLTKHLTGMPSNRIVDTVAKSPEVQAYLQEMQVLPPQQGRPNSTSLCLAAPGTASTKAGYAMTAARLPSTRHVAGAVRAGSYNPHMHVGAGPRMPGSGDYTAASHDFRPRKRDAELFAATWTAGAPKRIPRAAFKGGGAIDEPRTAELAMERQALGLAPPLQERSKLGRHKSTKAKLPAALRGQRAPADGNDASSTSSADSSTSGDSGSTLGSVLRAGLSGQVAAVAGMTTRRAQRRQARAQHDAAHASAAAPCHVAPTANALTAWRGLSDAERAAILEAEEPGKSFKDVRAAARLAAVRADNEACAAAPLQSRAVKLKLQRKGQLVAANALPSPQADGMSQAAQRTAPATAAAATTSNKPTFSAIRKKSAGVYDALYKHARVLQADAAAKAGPPPVRAESLLMRGGAAERASADKWMSTDGFNSHVSASNVNNPMRGTARAHQVAQATTITPAAASHMPAGMVAQRMQSAANKTRPSRAQGSVRDAMRAHAESPSAIDDSAVRAHTAALGLAQRGTIPGAVVAGRNMRVGAITGFHLPDGRQDKVGLALYRSTAPAAAASERALLPAGRSTTAR